MPLRCRRESMPPLRHAIRLFATPITIYVTVRYWQTPRCHHARCRAMPRMNGCDKEPMDAILQRNVIRDVIRRVRQFHICHTSLYNAYITFVYVRHAPALFEGSRQPASMSGWFKNE